VTSHSTLGGVVGVLQLSRRSHLRPTPAGLAGSGPEDSYAPCPTRQRGKGGRWVCHCACVDSSGYHRRRHTLDSRGERCIFPHAK